LKLEEMDKLQREFFVNVRAVQPALAVRTSEPHDAMSSMLAVGESKDWEIWVWDAKNGLHTADGKPMVQNTKQGNTGTAGLQGVSAMLSPMATLLSAIDQLVVYNNRMPKGDESVDKPAPRKPTILFLVNAHRFLDPHRQADILVQSLQQLAEDGKEMAKHVVIICPRGTMLPVELDPLFTVIDHARPGDEELTESLSNVLPDGGDLSINDKERKQVIEAGKGMTRFQFEAAAARCLVENKGVLTSDYVWGHKVELINRSPALTLYRGKETFDDLGGMEGMKDFAIRSLTSKCTIPDARARGIVIGGPPGTGKSAFCKALGNVVGRATLIFDVGALKGSLHGQTEQNLREVIDIADTMGRVILLID
jgi:ATPase family associated with various cellular activities (AAA)